MSWIAALEAAIRAGVDAAPGPLPPLSPAQRKAALDAADALGELDPGRALSSAVPDLQDVLLWTVEQLGDLVERLRDWIDDRLRDAEIAILRGFMDKLPHVAGWLIIEGVIVFNGIDGEPALDASRLRGWWDESPPFLSTEMWEALVGDLAGEDGASKTVAVLAALVLLPGTAMALRRGSLRVAPLGGAGAMTISEPLSAHLPLHRNWVSATFLPQKAGTIPADMFDLLPGLPPGPEITVAVRATTSRVDGEAQANPELWVGVRTERDVFEHRFGAAVPPDEAGFGDNWTLRIAPMATFGVGRVGGEWHAGFDALPNRLPMSPLVPPAMDKGVDITLSPENGANDIALGEPFGTQLIVADYGAYARIQPRRPVLEVGLQARAVDVYLSPRAFRSGIGAKLGDPERFREGMTFRYERAELAWHAGEGIRLNLQGRADAYVVIEKSLGPLTLHGVELALASDLRPRPTSAEVGQRVLDLTLSARFHLSLDLGVVVVAASGLGGWGGYRRLIGEEADFFGLHRPTGLGLEVTTPGVRGGGFVERRVEVVADRIEWGGVLELQLGTLGFTGFALYEQWVGAAEERPVSFLGILTVRYPVPIFAGLFLEGASLLLGMHREIDTDTMRRRLTGGALDSLFFPRDPIVQAPVILRDLRAFFPWKQGTHVAGMGIELSFLQICSLRLGAAMEIVVDGPAGARVGEIAFTGAFATPVLPKVTLAVIPDAEGVLRIVRQVYQINAHAVGVIDPGAGTFVLDAALVNSKLIDSMALSGDAAIRIATATDKHFEVTVGGFHPEYAGIKGRYPTLQRLGVKIAKKLPLSLRAEGYLAFTDAAFMMGGKLAGSGKLLGMKVEAWLYVDLLVEDKERFAFEATIGGGLSAKYKGFTLSKLTAKGTLRGCDPVTLRLQATVKFLWWDKSFERTFNLSRIAQDRIEREVSLPEEVILTFNRQSLTSGESVDGDVVARGRTTDDEAGELVVHPRARLTWRQTAAPLGVLVERYLNDPVVAGGQRLTARVEGMTPLVPPRAEFSHAAYRVLTRAERLVAAGFSEQDCGAAFGADGLIEAGDLQEFDETAVDEIRVGPLTPDEIAGLKPPVSKPAQNAPGHVRRMAAARRGPRRVRAGARFAGLPRDVAERRYEVAGVGSFGYVEARARARARAGAGSLPIAVSAPVLRTGMLVVSP